MKILLITILSMFVFILGAMAHEHDIQRQCKIDGRSGYSTWFGEIKCSPINE